MCDILKDTQSEQIRVRPHGALRDLHAADARYNKDCSVMFMSRRNINTASNKQSEDPLETEIATDSSHIWNSIELRTLYVSYSGKMTRRTLCLHLQEHFGSDLLTLSVKGVTNVLAFRSKVGSGLRLVDDDEDDLHESFEKIAKVIAKESKQLKQTKERMTQD